MYRITFPILLMLWLFSACDVFTLEEGIIYPSVYQQLDIEKVQSLNEEFWALNNNKICSTLNEFGFTGHSEVLFKNAVDPCSEMALVHVAMNEPDTLDAFVQHVLLKNTKFTGVVDEGRLSLRVIEPHKVLPINEVQEIESEVVEWRLVYENQSEKSVNIPSTEIEVIVNANGVTRILGNYYPEVYVPLVPNVDVEKAQEIVNEYKNVQKGPPLCTPPVNIQVLDSKKVILRKNGDLVEIRIGWPAISLFGKEHERECNFIVDMMDGSIIMDESKKGNRPEL